MSLPYFKDEAAVFDINSLYQRLESLEDCRARRGIRYNLAYVLMLVTLAKMAGEDTVRGIATWLRLRGTWLGKSLSLSCERMPHYTTISRILAKAVKVEQLDQAIGQFLTDLHKQNEQIQSKSGKWAFILIDGKALRGSIQIGETQGVHLLAAWDPDLGIVMMQLEVDKKENEICVAPRLLSMLDPCGRVVIGDAMHTQCKISIQIVEAGGHFVWFVKENQPKLYKDIARLFTEPEMRPGHHAVPTDFQISRSCDKGHGRIETRILTASSMLNEYVEFPHCGQVFQLERCVEFVRKGSVTKKTSEVVYGITALYSFDASPEELLYMTRHYWSIENALHHRRDVTFNEDACRLRDPTAQHVMASINNLALGLLLFQQHETTIPDERRYYQANLEEAIKQLTRSPARICA